MKHKHGPRTAALIIILLTLACPTFGAETPGSPTPGSTRFSLNLNNADIKTALQLIAAKAGLTLNFRADASGAGTISLNEENVTAADVLKRITAEHQLQYSISGSQLTVTGPPAAGAGARPSNGSAPSGQMHYFQLQYATASEMTAHIKSVIGTEERLIIDERSNNLIFVGSRSSFEKVKSLLAFLDVPPKQIAIEAQIVETSNQFLRELGVSLSTPAAGQTGNVEIRTSNGIGISAPNFTFKGLAGGLGGLEAKLAAAESKGDAKIVSRPKVTTLNNRQAKIESGQSFMVRSLTSNTGSPVSSGGSAASSAITSGLTTVSAGLTLDILPTILGNDMIRLTVMINNSQPDTGLSVDGIPAIRNNSANTSVVVKNGQTAVIAGLVRQENGKTNTSVPFLADIPILGILFRSSTHNDRTNELVIFITPSIDQYMEAKN